MTARFTLEALAHIADIRSYIEPKSPKATAHVVARIFAEADRLVALPRLGHDGQVAGTFEWTIHGLPYIIVYQFDLTQPLTVLGVYHGAQRRRPVN
jgi:toxin ParE1/3/4